MSTQKRVKIVVPGDDPVQIAGSPHLEQLKPYADIDLHTDRPQSSEEKVRRAKEADIIINTRGVVTWGAEDFKQLPNLKMITSRSIGTDMFDLEAAKAQGVILNGARGAVVDAPALVDALDSGHLGGVGIDVYDEEPVMADYPLLSCEQVVLTPHCADMTPEGVDLLNSGAVKNVIAYLKGEPINRVA